MNRKCNTELRKSHEEGSVMAMVLAHGTHLQKEILPSLHPSSRLSMPAKYPANELTIR